MDAGEITQRLATFKVLILDGDGVLFSVDEYRAVHADGTPLVMKSRNHHDAQGLSFLRALGIGILFASAEGEPLTSVIEKINALPSVKSGDWELVSALVNLQSFGTKVPSIEEWFNTRGFTWSDCVYIGDDRSDLEGMRLAGLAVAPANATRLIKRIVHLTLSKDGGHGAIREFAEMVLDVRGVDESTLPLA